MKKLLILLLTLLLVLALAACGDENHANTTIPQKPEDTTANSAGEDTTAAPEDTTAAPDTQDEVYYFEADGVKIVCGEAFDAAALPAVEPYEVPSCAFEGMDVIYTYEAFEVTAYRDNGGETVYSVYLLDPNVTTPEGLALGDDAARVTELYGSDYTENGGELTYQKGDTLLIVILQNDTVFSIEYRLAV